MERLLVLVGPTASGKTALAHDLAREHPLALVSADSQQVYRGMDIGTSKPEAAWRGAWDLVDVAEVGGPFSAGAFCRLAAEACRRAWASGRTPLLCGGTGLYLDALLAGLADLPAVPAEVREALEREHRLGGLAPLVRRLDAVDPVLAGRVDRANPRRVLRALEVHAATGVPLSVWQAKATRPSLEPEAVLWLGLDPGREDLNGRIALRAAACFEAGWPAEVGRLALAHGDEALLQSRAIGYRELLDHLRGRLGREAALEAVVARTRRYARRQRTWFRARPGIVWGRSAEELAPAARAFLG